MNKIKFRNVARRAAISISLVGTGALLAAGATASSPALAATTGGSTTTVNAVTVVGANHGSVPLETVQGWQRVFSSVGTGLQPCGPKKGDGVVIAEDDGILTWATNFSFDYDNGTVTRFNSQAGAVKKAFNLEVVAQVAQIPLASILSGSSCPIASRLPPNNELVANLYTLSALLAPARSQK